MKITLAETSPFRIASGGISTFGNLIVKSFGYDAFQTILFNIPFGAIQILVIIGSAWIATKTQRKGLVIAGIAVFPSIGTILMLTVDRQYKGVLLFGYYLVRNHPAAPTSHVESLTSLALLRQTGFSSLLPSRPCSIPGRLKIRVVTLRRNAPQPLSSSACALAMSSAPCSTAKIRLRRDTARVSSPT